MGPDSIQSLEGMFALRSPLVSATKGAALTGVVSMENQQSGRWRLRVALSRIVSPAGWRLCGESVMLNAVPPEVRLPSQRWAYGLILTLNRRALRTLSKPAIVTLRMTVRGGTIGVMGTDSGLSRATTAEYFCGDGEHDLDLLVEDTRETAAIVVRNVSDRGERPTVRLTQTSAYEATGVRLAPKRHDLAHDLFIVLSPPKTATQTVERTLENISPAFPVRRTHYFSPDSEAHARNRAKSKKNITDSILRVADYTARLRREVEFVKSSGGTLAFIAGIRDPIGRMVASIFQSLTNSEIHQLDANRSSRFQSLQYEIISRLAAELKAIRTNDISFRGAGTFFQDDLLLATGMDVLRYPFPHDKGFMVVRGDNITTLVYRFEDIGHSLAPALEAVTGHKPIQIMNENRSDDKSYRDVYRDFQNWLKIPADLCSSYYECNPYVKHFYSADEIAKFGAKWSTMPQGSRS